MLAEDRLGRIAGDALSALVPVDDPAIGGEHANRVVDHAASRRPKIAPARNNTAFELF
ncbi:hypothetical protein [Bradyrhizobium elkanii]|uniref:hypothetical protein n=1 Tax=Bradyrhizobium elkanii TaxID=29448 RepID=UPI003D24AC9D